MSAFTQSTLNYPQNADTPIRRVKGKVDPGERAAQGLALGDEWLNEETNTWFKVVSHNSGSGNWVKLGAAAGGTVDQVTALGNSFVVVPSSGNINFTGGSGVTVTGSGSTVTIALTGGTASVTGVTVDTVSAPGVNPVVPNGSGDITFTGAQIATQGIPQVIRTKSSAANNVTIEIQQAGSVPTVDSTKNGVCHFNSDQFTVDGNGFVSFNGAPIQQQRANKKTLQTIGAQMPYDNTIPQQSEGDQIMSVSITPTRADTILEVQVVINAWCAGTGANTFYPGVIALFRGSSVNAIAAAPVDADGSQTTGPMTTVSIQYYETSGGTSAITYNVRGGPGTSGGALDINGSKGAALFGGVCFSSITVTEWDQ